MSFSRSSSSESLEKFKSRPKSKDKSTTKNSNKLSLSTGATSNSSKPFGMTKKTSAKKTTPIVNHNGKKKITYDDDKVPVVTPISTIHETLLLKYRTIRHKDKMTTAKVWVKIMRERNSSPDSSLPADYYDRDQVSIALFHAWEAGRTHAKIDEMLPLSYKISHRETVHVLTVTVSGRLKGKKYTIPGHHGATISLQDSKDAPQSPSERYVKFILSDLPDSITPHSSSYHDFIHHVHQVISEEILEHTPIVDAVSNIFSGTIEFTTRKAPIGLIGLKKVLGCKISWPSHFKCGICYNKGHKEEDCTYTRSEARRVVTENLEAEEAIRIAAEERKIQKRLAKNEARKANSAANMSTIPSTSEDEGQAEVTGQDCTGDISTQSPSDSVSPSPISNGTNTVETATSTLSLLSGGSSVIPSITEISPASESLPSPPSSEYMTEGTNSNSPTPQVTVESAPSASLSDMTTLPTGTSSSHDDMDSSSQSDDSDSGSDYAEHVKDMSPSASSGTMAEKAKSKLSAHIQEKGVSRGSMGVDTSKKAPSPSPLAPATPILSFKEIATTSKNATQAKKITTAKVPPPNSNNVPTSKGKGGKTTVNPPSESSGKGTSKPSAKKNATQGDATSTGSDRLLRSAAKDDGNQRR